MVREAVGSAIPKRRKKTNRPRWKIAAVIEFVDRILETDKKARKTAAVIEGINAIKFTNPYSPYTYSPYSLQPSKCSDLTRLRARLGVEVHRL